MHYQKVTHIGFSGKTENFLFFLFFVVLCKLAIMSPAGRLPPYGEVNINTGRSAFQIDPLFVFEDEISKVVKMRCPV